MGSVRISEATVNQGSTVQKDGPIMSTFLINLTSDAGRLTFCTHQWFDVINYVH